MTNWIQSYVWLIPLLPLTASLGILGLTSKGRRGTALLAISAQVIAFFLALAAFISTLGQTGQRFFHNFIWFHFGAQTLRLGLLLDPLTAVMLLMITFVGSWIFVFSAGYMAEDEHFSRFFAYLSFFSAAMLGLVLANSLLLLFICWELVGLASYLLIGFWIHKPAAGAAAKKAFITTRIGDMAFFLGMLWLYDRSGTLLFYDGGRGCLEPPVLLSLGTSSTFIALLIFGGAVGKSGQFPLHIWLPDAMEGPTPVSAFIHAATMVAAGVFLVARVYPLFSLGAVHGVTFSLTVVVWVGVVTALISAFIALGQFDIKRILAYSTISQLGLMMVSLGVGGVVAGILHLLAHAFFKALLFLGSGSVIHGCNGEQDIRRMGALGGRMPVTFVTYTIGMMALSGVPVFFAGAWTKEDVLQVTSLWPASRVPYYLMLLGVVLTALYMTRQMIYVFFGQPRESASHPHESPPVMTLPLIVLAGSVLLVSVVLTPAWPWLSDYLSGQQARIDLGLLIERALLVSLLFVVIGIGLGILIYRRAASTDPVETRMPVLFRFLENRMWFDELYRWIIVAPARAAAYLADFFDRYFWDGLVRGIGTVARSLGSLTKGFDEKAINAGANDAAAVTRACGRLLSLRHSGQVQAYLGVIAAATLALLLLYAWLI